MAKFCGNCGTKLDDSAKVCGNCGTPLQNNSGNISSSVPEFKYVDPEKKARNQKKLIIGIVCVAVLVIAMIAWNIVSGFIGYKGVVRKVMNAYEDYDIETLVNMSSEYYLFDESNDYVESYFQNAISADLDYLESVVGHSYSIDYTIEDSYSMSKHKFENLLDVLSGTSDFDADIITEVMIVELGVTAKGEQEETTTVTLTLTKEEGDWKLLYID